MSFKPGITIRGTDNLKGNIFAEKIKKNYIIISEPGGVAHTFNPSTREAEAGGSLCSTPTYKS